MKFSKFQQRVKEILDVELPSGASIASEGRSIAKDIRPGRTAFMDKMGVDSEANYKSTDHQKRSSDKRLVLYSESFVFYFRNLSWRRNVGKCTKTRISKSEIRNNIKIRMLKTCS